MISLDEDALICDFAETYQIYNYRSLPVGLAATLAAGLRDNSRIKLIASRAPVAQDIILLAAIADRIEAFRYGFTEDASSGKNKPKSLVSVLYGEDDNQHTNTASFDNAEAFEEALARIRGQ